jgi:molecular chaperone DnaK
MAAESEHEIVVGIDLGTTFSVAAIVDAEGRPVTIPNAEGDLSTPSVIFLDKQGAVVGKEAVKSAEFEPERTATHPKRDMGEEFFRSPVRGGSFRPEVLQALILKKLKTDVEAKLGPVRRAVITVPAYFNEPRRKATQDAGRMAGWDVLDIINEPTAAAIAYGTLRGFLKPSASHQAAETILTYDLGGGTFDVTLMRVEGNCFTTLATAGDVELGGIDWDRRLADLLAERFIAEGGADPRTDPAAALRLLREAEDAKRSLSSKSEVVVPFSHDGRRMRTTVTRSEFEALTGALVDRTVFTLRKLLRESGTQVADLTRLLVVGGSSRMPMIRAALERETGFAVDQVLSVDEAVAHGAAVYAQYLVRRERGADAGFQVKNVNSHTLGVLAIEPATRMKRRKPMIQRNTPLSAEHTQRFATAEAGQKNVAVTVVEGGDDSGNNATLIGHCVLDGLDPNLPPRSPVEVTFHYSDNGRLDVRAFMPTLGREATLTIERARGMPEETLVAWYHAVAAGLPDGLPLPEGTGGVFGCEPSLTPAATSVAAKADATPAQPKQSQPTASQPAPQAAQVRPVQPAAAQPAAAQTTAPPTTVPSSAATSTDSSAPQSKPPVEPEPRPTAAGKLPAKPPEKTAEKPAGKPPEKAAEKVADNPAETPTGKPVEKPAPSPAAAAPVAKTAAAKADAPKVASAPASAQTVLAPTPPAAPKAVAPAPAVGPVAADDEDPESVFVDALPPSQAAGNQPLEGPAIDVTKGPKKTGFRVSKKVRPQAAPKPQSPPPAATPDSAAAPAEEKKKPGWKFW